MATFTEHYTLAKPDEEDYYSIEDFNGNMDIIDDHMAEFDEKIEGIETSVSTLNNTVDDINTSINGGGGSSGDGSSLKDTVDNTAVDIATLKTKVDTVSANVNTVSSNVNTISTNVNTANSTLNSMNSTLGTVNTTVSGTNTTVNTVNTNVSSVKTDVSSIKNTVNSMNSYLNNSSSSSGLASDLLQSLGTKYCVASNNAKFQIKNYALDSLLASAGTRTMLKLFDFEVEYNGNIRLDFDYTLLCTIGLPLLTLNVYTVIPTELADLPNYSAVNATHEDFITQPTYPIEIEHLYLTEYSDYLGLELPVTAGQKFTFCFSYQWCTKFNIDNFRISYDVKVSN